MSARVTVVTRTRDRAVLLARAVASLQAQTFSDYELVIVNDAGAPEAVTSVLKGQGEDFLSRVTVVTNETSQGREAALEAGLAVSACEYLAVHDDDDTWAPGFLERTVAEMDAHPEYGAVATRCEVVYEHVEAGNVTEDGRETLAASLHAWTLLDTLVANYVPPISQLVRRSVADAVGHWDGTLQTQADWEFNLRLLAHAPVGFIDGEPLAFWHQRPATGSALGNSVVEDAVRHVTDNAAIRDRHLRWSAGDGGLGLALAISEYYRRADKDMRRTEHVLSDRIATLEETAQRLERQVAQTDLSLGVLHQAVHSLTTAVTSLHAGLGQELRLTREIHRRVVDRGASRARRVLARVATATGRLTGRS